jgi:F-type H+-transporting ATPase subunit a
MHDPFEKNHLLGHVKDADYFDVPRFVSPDGKLHIPQPFAPNPPITTIQIGAKEIDSRIEPMDLRITKFMVLETVAALLIAVLFIGLARKISRGRPPRGRLWNLLEAMLLYIRDQVARPAIGEHDGDRFVPLLWTMFFFVLTCNLLGLLPSAGTATGALGTTAALAFVTFLVVVGSGMAKLGPLGFWLHLVPSMDLPIVLAIFLYPLIFVIELLGLIIKHMVLAVRLLANMLGGHLVLAVIIGFIVASAHHAAWYGVAPASVFAAAMLSVLELMFAFIQAYIFTFLSAIFIGMAVHPH